MCASGAVNMAVLIVVLMLHIYFFSGKIFIHSSCLDVYERCPVILFLFISSLARTSC